MGSCLEGGNSAARNNYRWYGSEFLTGETARDVTRDTAKYVARCVAFESVKEKFDETNPFEFIIELYSMGLRPTYFRKMDEQEKFVVDFSIKMDDKNILDCYLHDDKEISFTHQWIEYCTNLKPTNNPESKRSFVYQKQNNCI